MAASFLVETFNTFYFAFCLVVSTSVILLYVHTLEVLVDYSKNFLSFLLLLLKIANGIDLFFFSF